MREREDMVTIIRNGRPHMNIKPSQTVCKCNRTQQASSLRVVKKRGQ